MKRNLILAGITAVLLAAGVLGCILVQRPDSGTIAVIYQNGVEMERIDLSQVTDSHTITLYGENGEENVILIEPSAISMKSANCPDGRCTHMAPLTGKGIPIVCLPHHIVIEIVRGDGEDSAYDIRTY